MAAIAMNSFNQAAADPGTVSEPFPELDPGCVSDAIPAFFIGRNKDGFWVARDARGRTGGLFLFESGARSFARRNSDSSGCATIHPTEAFELDLRNMGNPLVTCLGSLKRLAMRIWRQMAALIGG